MYPNYPNSSGYPNQPNYGNAGSNYAPYPAGNIGFSEPGFGGYPGQQQPGYPGQQPGFPGQQPGYPGQQSGYPSYPGQQQPGYPGQQSGYPGQQAGYPGQQPGYPGLPQPGYPEQQLGYPGQQTGYPGQQPGYPGQQQGYPVEQNYPGQQGMQSGGYPNIPGYNPINTNSSFPPFNPESNSNFPPFRPPPPVAETSHFSNPSLYPELAKPNSFNQMSPIQYEPTLKVYQPFNPNDDAGKLYKAMKGFGTDEATIIDVLCKRTSVQRLEIICSYKSGYGKDLIQNLKSELSGNFELLIKSMMRTPAQLEAHDLKKAIEGAGTDEDSLIDILCTKTNSEMRDLKIAYKQMYNKDLEKAVGGDVSGYFKRFLVSLSAAYRSENPPDQSKAVQQARELYDAGANRLGTDEVKFNRIFATESFPHLKLVFEEYQKLAHKDIEKAICDEMSGDVERAFLCVVKMARNPPLYFATRLADSMKGAGTYDRALIRNVILRSERDMVQVKMEFQRKYGRSLEATIKNDCSGDYKRGLLCLIGDPNWR